MGHVDKAKSKANMNPSVEFSRIIMKSLLLHALVANLTTVTTFINPKICIIRLKTKLASLATANRLLHKGGLYEFTYSNAYVC